jgi:hypothetical protein
MANDPIPSTLFFRTWVPRIGKKAAILLRSGFRRGILAVSLGPIWIGLTAGGAKAHWPALWGPGVAVAIVEAGLLASAARQMLLSNREASRVLGVRIGFRAPGPPTNDAKYLEWCRAHGVTPYAADKNDASERPAVAGPD